MTFTIFNIKTTYDLEDIMKKLGLKFLTQNYFN